MKLIVQIPCWNEEETVAEVVRSVPRSIPGVSRVEVVVIDDGSGDRTAECARQAGADEVVVMPRHCGLAATFSVGVSTALRRGADLLVNTDADLQYPSEQIPSLIAPLLSGQADIVIGDRLNAGQAPFSWVKMQLERLGSAVVRFLSGVPVHDAASGFRALNREAMEEVFVRGTYSYTLETLIQAGMKGLRIANVPIRTNPPRRSSRLFRSLPGYVMRSAVSILRAYLMYHPLRSFWSLGAVLLAGALGIGVRYLVFFLRGAGSGHVQSLILLAVLALMGFECIVVGLIGDVVAGNRVLLESLRRRHLPKPDTEYPKPERSG